MRNLHCPITPPHMVPSLGMTHLLGLELFGGTFQSCGMCCIRGNFPYYISYQHRNKTWNHAWLEVDERQLFLCLGPDVSAIMWWASPNKSYSINMLSRYPDDWVYLSRNWKQDTAMKVLFGRKRGVKFSNKYLLFDSFFIIFMRLHYIRKFRGSGPQKRWIVLGFCHRKQ